MCTPVHSKTSSSPPISRVLDSIYLLQHGFQSHKSFMSQLLQVIHEIGQAFDKDLESDLIYLDFEKALDSVCHTKLFGKLECYSICDPLLKWFKCYIHGRLQRVVINGPCSASKDVKSRVPQGSLLGPILCLIYVNDMPTVTTGSTLAMFADDSKCYKC